MRIHESAENYLETILILKERLGNVRSIDIVNELNFSKPSVSVAMKRLRENDYIEMDDDGYIKLKEKGLEIAKDIYAKHRVISEMLIRIGVSPETAAEDACKIEHNLSEESFSKLKEHFMKNLNGKIE